MEEFSHNQAASRFEVTVDGRFAGEAHYVLADGVATFDHTEVREEFGGRGIAGRLVRYALDDVRAAGEWKIVPVCPYVTRWLRAHPEYGDLLA